MDPTNRISRYLPVPLNPVRLDLHAEYFRDLHRETVQPSRVGQQGSFTHRMIIDAYFRELQAATNEPGRAPPPTEEGIRIHAWLSDRLAALDRTRSGLWPRLVRFLRAMFALAKSG